MVQTGMQVDELMVDRFKRLCWVEKQVVGETVQHLREACLEAGSASF